MNKLKASELFIFGFNGYELGLELERFLKNNNVGGLILFKRNIESLEQVIALNSSIIERNVENPSIISVDQEGGRVARLRDICTEIPPMKKLLKYFLKNRDLAYRIGAMQARELSALGFNLNFSPVVDVLTNPKNEVIGDRAFSDNEKEVAMISSRFIAGMQGAGVASSAKHFPGHGSTLLDSHFALPIDKRDFDSLNRIDLVPFREAISNNVASIMTAHVIMESLDSVLPATMSKKVINDLLRKDLGYRGVVISDDLDMKAVSENYGLEEILEKSLLASVDMFIIGNNFEKTMMAIEILQKMLEKSPSLKELAEKSILRIKNLKERYIGRPAAPSMEQVKLIVRSRPHMELMEPYLESLG